MPWLADAFQGVRSRGTGLRDLLSESARELAARTQQFEEAVTHSVANYLQGAPTARELEARLEADAKRLARPGPAAEVLQRWLALIRGGTQVRYPDGQQPSQPSQGHLLSSALSKGGLLAEQSVEEAAPLSPALSAAAFLFAADAPAGPEPSPGAAAAVPELTFHQVFLRSRALELALDSATRVSELRTALRERALPPPEAWPEEPSAPVAFARAFVLLLELTLGPAERWLPLLGALLSSDKGPVDDQCHAWLVQLLVGGRANWAEVAVAARVSEVEAAEEAASIDHSGLDATPDSATAPGSLALLLAGVARRGRAAEAGYRAWSLRSGLGAALARLAAQREDAIRERENFASTIALVASERAKELEETAARQQTASEEKRGGLRKQESELREQLGSLQPQLQQTERELEQAEMTHRELLQQVALLSARMEALRQLRCEQARAEESLRAELQRTEGASAAALAAEDEVQGRTTSARALAETVAELASSLAAAAASAPAPPGSPCSRSRSSVEGSGSKAEAAAVALAERELERLRLLSRTASACAEVAEERRRSRQAMVELGVPAATLESDVVGEAEISQALTGTLAELDRCRDDLERLCKHLAAQAPAW